MEWLDRFHGHKDGDEAFTDTSDYLRRMMLSPSEESIVVFGHPKGYFKREFKVKVDPSNLANRIMAARENVADELVEDLHLIEAENLELKRQHFESRVTSPDRLSSTKARIFDHDVLESDQTPLRGVTYKKIKLLLTDMACKRTVVRLRDTSNHEYMWMLEYMACHPVQDGDEFIANLLRQPGLQRTNPAQWIDPSKIAGTIMMYRLVIAGEWEEELKSARAENMAVKRDLLEMSLNSTLQSPQDSSD